MTKKDFELIAKTIRLGVRPHDPHDSARADLALKFSAALRATNPRFDASTFLTQAHTRPLTEDEARKY